jgi:hypothetical protein
MLLSERFLPFFGSVGMGLMWGWLLVALEGRVRRPWCTVPAMFLSTLAMAVPVTWFQGGPGLAVFGGATLVAWWVHLGWRQALRRYASFKTEQKERL